MQIVGWCGHSVAISYRTGLGQGVTVRETAKNTRLPKTGAVFAREAIYALDMSHL